MPKLKLTDAAVQRIKAPPGARIDFFDASLGGFGIRVSGPPAGRPDNPCRKTWFLFYRFRGEQKRLTLEPIYPALGLGDARKQAHAALSQLAEGIDPSAAKAEEKRAGDTIESVVDQYLARRPKAGRRPFSPRYLAESRRNFDNHIIPRWRGRNIGEITRREVNDLVDAVFEGGTTVKDESGKKRRVPGGPIAANRVLSSVSGLFNWAMARGIVEATPAARIQKPAAEKAGQRALDANGDQGEIRSVWPEFEALGYPFGAFFQLALLTGQRREEVAAMRWDEIDENECVWTLATERTKSGRAHVVPLSPLAMSILEGAKADRLALFAACSNQRLPIGPFVITTKFSAPISGYSGAKAKLDKAIRKARTAQELDELPAWRVHDLRRTVATHLAAMGTDKSVIARILNHAASGVTDVHYNKYLYLAERRQALDAWALRLLALVAPEKFNNVVPMRGVGQQ